MKITHLFAILCLVRSVKLACYFPASYQGEFLTQSYTTSTSSDLSLAMAIPITYSTISIQYDSIPIWGYCHSRIGNNVILMDDTGSITCFRCFRLALHSSNILQIHTRGLEKCFTSEEAALLTCVGEEGMQEDVSEVMLYRTKGFMGEPAVSPTFCPFNGEYSFTYSVNDGSERELECASRESEVSDCPYGFGLNMRFQDCVFGDKEMSYHCLGDWDGGDGERYVALMDTQANMYSLENIGENKPLYRCAKYKEDPETGRIKMALSSDSTCVSHLHSADMGYETLVLHPKEAPSWPDHLTSSCIFPDWLQGEWEHLHFHEDTMVYKDHRNFKTYTGKCVPHSEGYTERFLVLTRTQCGEEEYKCVWVKERGVNTMEVQVSIYGSEFPDISLCREENFQERTWITQGRLETKEKAPYMFTGEYTGVIPDTEGLCAKLYSDCNNPEIMFYTIFNCFDRTEVFEEREYESLGQWEEEGKIYTYTQRRDMEGHECFVGVTTRRGEIFLQEAGTNCERGLKPTRYGMRMKRVAQCYHTRRNNPKVGWNKPQRDRGIMTGGSASTSCKNSILLLTASLLTAVVRL